MKMNELPAAGLLAMVSGTAMVVPGSAGEGNLSTGVFVLIGPFPVVFGTGTNGGQLGALALVVGLVMLALLSELARRLASTVRDSSKRLWDVINLTLAVWSASHVLC